MELVTIARFENTLDAYICLEKLKSEGIECYLADSNMVELLTPQAFGGIKLRVEQSDEKRALELLNENEGEIDTDND